jgi:hypothetical protein
MLHCTSARLLRVSAIISAASGYLRSKESCYLSKGACTLLRLASQIVCSISSSADRDNLLQSPDSPLQHSTIHSLRAPLLEGFAILFGFQYTLTVVTKSLLCSQPLNPVLIPLIIHKHCFPALIFIFTVFITQYSKSINFQLHNSSVISLSSGIERTRSNARRNSMWLASGAAVIQCVARPSTLVYKEWTAL